MKILIADDDLITLDVLGSCLADEGFEVIQAGDGKEAIHLWESQSPDLVCLDIMMPEYSGYEVCKFIRKKSKDVPILFLSAKREERDVITGLDLGADDFIRKPFNRGEVMARIRAALRRSPTMQKVQGFKMNDLVIHPGCLFAERNDLKIELTQREVNILQVLYKNSGTPVSRDKLLDECWGVDYFPDSRTLDQHISTLRRKIEDQLQPHPIIQTVRGVGYKYDS